MNERGGFVIATIIPAAGASRRLGSPKQLAIFDGESLLRRSIRRAVEAKLGPVIVVLGYESNRLLQDATDLPCELLTIDDWQEGMSASIRAGITRTAADATADAALVTLVDQWALTTQDLMRLAHAYRSGTASIAAAEYADGTVGVPAIFARAYFNELLSLTGDIGARHLLRSRGTDITLVGMPNAGPDFDGTPEPQTLSDT